MTSQSADAGQDGRCYLDCGRMPSYALHVEPIQPHLFDGNVVALCADCTAWWRTTGPAVRSVRTLAPDAELVAK